jgi:hypothetical protein
MESEKLDASMELIMSDYKSPLKSAICEFKKKGITIKKGTENPFFKSKYADLATVLDAIEETAADCGLVIYSQLVAGESSVLTTTLSHKDSDECLVSSFPVFGTKPQEIGSSISYARRYNIQSLLNLAAEDDDGNAGNTPDPAGSTPDPVIDTEAAVEIDLMITKSGADRAKFFKHFNVENASFLKVSQLASAKKLLEQKMAAKNG